MVEAFARVASVELDPISCLSAQTTTAQVRQPGTAARVGLAERIHFLGLLKGPELLGAYADADLLLLLSHRENFGMVAAEAMAAGVPLLLSHDVGLAAEVQHAEAGLVVSATLDEVARAWSCLLSDPLTRSRMGQNGRKLVQEQFASPVVAGKMLQVLQEVAGKAPSKVRSDFVSN